MTTKVALLAALIAGHTDSDDEVAVIELLRTASASELNEMLAGVAADDLVSSMDDRVIGPDRRRELLDLLTVQRRADLDIPAHAAIIYALQSGRTDTAAERRIRDLFLGLTGPAVTRLKNQINSRVDQHDLEGLVFVDIDDAAVRTEILDHFAAQAATWTGPREAKVLSDIDDTAVARIHESRYPKGTLYPGVLAFYQALDQGPLDAPFSTGDLTFVTARPMDALGLIENHSRSALRKAGISQLSVLSGSFRNLATKEGMAEKKVENIAHYCALYPEYDMVFIGDSGQGDILVGEAILAAHPTVVKAVFIHDVVDTSADQRADYRRRGIHLVDSYVGAATVARDLGLISQQGLDRVIAETQTGLNEVAWTSPNQESALRATVEKDISDAGSPRPV